MVSMVSTDDDILNLTGGLIAQAMIDFSNGDWAALDRMMDGFDAYLETCRNLGVR